MRAPLCIMLLLSFQVSACMYPAPQGQRHERSGDGDNRHEDNGSERDHEQRHNGRD